jgi:hypothetical protein
MTPGRLARGYAWVVVGLRHVIVLAWIVGAVAATLYLPGLGGAAAGDESSGVAVADAGVVGERRISLALAHRAAVPAREGVTRGVRGLARASKARRTASPLR